MMDKNSDGSYTQNGWEKINNKWYLFDSQGYMLYDWKRMVKIGIAYLKPIMIGQ